jgi:hypothetical protein
MRRRRIKRWLAAWRRLIEFGKMLERLNDGGFTLAVYSAEGSPVMARRRRSMPDPRQSPLETAL